MFIFHLCRLKNKPRGGVMNVHLFLGLLANWGKRRTVKLWSLQHNILSKSLQISYESPHFTHLHTFARFEYFTDLSGLLDPSTAVRLQR